MKKSLKQVFACLLAALLLTAVAAPAFAEGETPVFKAHVVGSADLHDEETPVYVKPGETVLVWFDLQEADEVYIPGWISKTLTEAGFELAYDPEFAEENYCAKVTVPENLAEGAEGLLEINWYKPGELYGIYEGRWSDAPVYYTHTLTFIVVASSGPQPYWTDGEQAVRSGDDVYVASGYTLEELRKQANGCAVSNAAGESIEGGGPVRSGMTLLLVSGDVLNVIVKGDNDGDGEVTAADARFALRVAVELDTPNDWQKKASLIDDDDEVTAADARGILRAAVDLDKLALK